MIRQPTPESEVMSWYNSWLSGDVPPIHEGDPRAGFFKMKKWRLGPWLPVRIWLHQEVDEVGELSEPEVLLCTVDGEPKDPMEMWTWITPVTPEEYQSLVEPRPTPASVAYAWHRAAIAGESPPRHKDHPQCGWYKTQLVSRGPWVAARISMRREIGIRTGLLIGRERLSCEVDGSIVDAREAWPSLTPISKAEYDALLHRRNLIPEMQASMARVDLVAVPILPE